MAETDELVVAKPKKKAKLQADIDEVGGPTASQVTVTRTVKGKETTEDEMLAVHQFITEPAVVSVAFGGTANLGNFESAKFSVAVSIPCYKEELDETYNYAKRLVERKVKFAMKQIREELDQG